MDFSKGITNGGPEYEASLRVNQPEAPDSLATTIIALSLMMLAMTLFFLRLLNIKKKRMVKEHSLYCTLERNLRE
jgi:hypothetical protein